MYESNPQRYVSLLTRKTLALVMAGGRGSRLHELTVIGEAGGHLPG